MRFRIQTDGKKFRVQARAWWSLGVWVIGAIDDDCFVYRLFRNRAEAEAWIAEQEQTKPKWRTV